MHPQCRCCLHYFYLFPVDALYMLLVLPLSRGHWPLVCLFWCAQSAQVREVVSPSAFCACLAVGWASSFLMILSTVLAVVHRPCNASVTGLLLFFLGWLHVVCCCSDCCICCWYIAASYSSLERQMSNAFCKVSLFSRNRHDRIPLSLTPITIRSRSISSCISPNLHVAASLRSLARYVSVGSSASCLVELNTKRSHTAFFWSAHPVSLGCSLLTSVHPRSRESFHVYHSSPFPWLIAVSLPVFSPLCPPVPLRCSSSSNVPQSTLNLQLHHRSVSFLTAVEWKTLSVPCLLLPISLTAAITNTWSVCAWTKSVTTNKTPPC